jgi:hypothetical protein
MAALTRLTSDVVLSANPVERACTGDLQSQIQTPAHADPGFE